MVFQCLIIDFLNHHHLNHLVWQKWDFSVPQTCTMEAYLYHQNSQLKLKLWELLTFSKGRTTDVSFYNSFQNSFRYSIPFQQNMQFWLCSICFSELCHIFISSGITIFSTKHNNCFYNCRECSIKVIKELKSAMVVKWNWKIKI